MSNNDFWLIACVPDGESIYYLDMSDDTAGKDILTNGNWEDDGLILPEEDLPPGIYKFKLHVRGGQDNYDPYDYWMESQLEVVKVIWQYKQSWFIRLRNMFK